MRVPQLDFQLITKDNEINRQTKMRLNLKKELEKDLQQAYELRTQVDSMKNYISSLQKDIKELQDVNSEQKVSLILLIVSVLSLTRFLQLIILNNSLNL